MNRKSAWLAGMIFVVAALILTACGTGTTTTATAPAQQTTSSIVATTPAAATSVAAANKPQYGGTFNVLYTQDITGFDQAYTVPFWTITEHLTNDTLLQGDWAKGPAGTGQFNWTNNGVYRWDCLTGGLAQSWQIVKPGQFVLNIRHGVHFGLDSTSAASRLVNGRELTAADVVYSINRVLTTPTSYLYTAYPHLVAVCNVTAPDKYTVDINVPSDDTADIYNVFASVLPWDPRVIPHEVVDKYGSLQDWHNSVGSGPFFLTDYVSASSATLKKNPNYWMTDPVGPGKGNQLPYVDGLNILIITDASTQLAAARTARLDQIGPEIYDNAEQLRKSAPDMVSSSFIPAGSYAIFMRTDQAPFNDVRVRHALMMATDFESLGTSLVGPGPILQTFPITPGDGLQDAYLPLDQASADVQALYKYNPDQAKALLAEAGYPDGFKTTVTTSSTPTFNTDYLSAIKSQWAKVGVDISINVVEQGVYLNIWGSRKYNDMFYGGVPSSGTYTREVALTGTGAGWDLSYVNDPQINASVPKMEKFVNAQEDKESATVYKNLEPYILSQAWAIPTPVSAQYVFWWPWLKNYHGELSVGILSELQWADYVWIDQGLKTQMGH